MTRTRSIEVLASQLDRLEAKAAELAAMRTYLRAKIDWLSGGEIGPPPELGS
jgi:MerR family copper efflux transcriptional regulator